MFFGCTTVITWDTTKKLLENYYEAKVNHNHPNFHMIWEIVKEEHKYLRARINLFNKAKLLYSSTNYLFIEKLAGDEMRQINDKCIAEKSIRQVNNTKLTKTNSTLHKKCYLKT